MPSAIKLDGHRANESVAHTYSMTQPRLKPAEAGGAPPTAQARGFPRLKARSL
jgi:hypothetical protein